MSYDGMDKVSPGSFCRRKQALFVILVSGIFGVLLDLDHIVCAVLGLGEIDPEKGNYGCRLLHDYFVPAGYIIGGIILTCLVGWVLFVVYSAIGTIATDNSVVRITKTEIL